MEFSAITCPVENKQTNNVPPFRFYSYQMFSIPYWYGFVGKVSCRFQDVDRRLVKIEVTLGNEKIQVS